VYLAVADMDEGRDVAAQIEQRVQFDRRLGRAEWRPRKHRQAQIDGGRVQCVDRFLQVDTKGLVHIQWPSDADQALREVGIDAPVAYGVRVGQSIARDRRANSEVIQLGPLSAQTRFDVAQTFSIGQLRKRHTQELIQAGERLDLAFALIPGHTTAKRGQRKMLHQLREHPLALVHRSSPRSCVSQGRRTRLRRSNRDQDHSWLLRF